MRSSIWAGSSWGTLARTSVTTCAVRSSGRQVTREPLLARPIGVRPVATMTASGMGRLLLLVRFSSGRRRTDYGDPASLGTAATESRLPGLDDAPHDHVGPDLGQLEDVAPGEEFDPLVEREGRNPGVAPQEAPSVVDDVGDEQVEDLAAET